MSGHSESPAQPARPPNGSRADRTSRRPRRRAHGLGGTLAVTTMAALLPGSGLIWSRRRGLGLLVLVPSLAGLGFLAWYFGRDLDAAVRFVFDPVRLKVAAGVLAGALVLWALLLVTTYTLVRPEQRSRTETVLGSAFVLVLCAAVAAPVMLGAQYARVQASLVETVFQDNQSATAPKHVTEADPWGGRDRVNLLLLGGDGSVHRPGVRTDSMILASIDTRTGRTVMFSLPRNMMNAQFPPGSPLHELYPDGYTGPGDPANYMLNAVYRIVPTLHPGVLGDSDNEGADALKQAVAGSLDQPVDYYLLVNLLGFRQIVDAMGGVTVNINEPVPIGGNTDLGIPPDDYLQPGPDQRLDGFEALWYSRGRYGSDDYHRMERQRCMIDAIIEEADPVTLLRRYQALAETGKQIVRTDIPRTLLPAFVDLAMEMKGSPVRSVVFRSSDRFFPGDPDFAWMRETVRKALAPARARPGGAQPTTDPSESGSPSVPATPVPSVSASPDPGAAVDTEDTCAYRAVP